MPRTLLFHLPSSNPTYPPLVIQEEKMLKQWSRRITKKTKRPPELPWTSFSVDSDHWHVPRIIRCAPGTTPPNGSKLIFSSTVVSYFCVTIFRAVRCRQFGSESVCDLWIHGALGLRELRRLPEMAAKRV